MMWGRKKVVNLQNSLLMNSSPNVDNYFQIAQNNSSVVRNFVMAVEAKVQWVGEAMLANAKQESSRYKYNNLIPNTQDAAAGIVVVAPTGFSWKRSKVYLPLFVSS